jgi:hypothetical protein
VAATEGIRERIGELWKTWEKQTGITVAIVIAEIVDARDRAKAGGDLRAELKALELLGKHVGAFEKDNIQRAFILQIR